MKKILLYLFAVVALASCNTQPGIRFSYDYNAALDQAKKDGKPLFVVMLEHGDELSETMLNDVFPDTVVGEYYNEHFLSVLLWSDSDKTRELASRYGFFFYPAFLFLSPEEGFLKKDVGYRDREDLLRLGRNYREPQAARLAALSRAYNAGTIGTDSLLSYIRLSSAFGLRTEKALERWIGLAGERALTKEVFELISGQECSVESVPFRFVASHVEAFARAVGRQEVELYLYGKYFRYLRGLKKEREEALAAIRESGYAYVAALEEHLALGQIPEEDAEVGLFWAQVERLAEKYPLTAPFIAGETMRLVNRSTPVMERFLLGFMDRVGACAPERAVEVARYVANNYLIVYADVVAADAWVNCYLKWSDDPNFEKRMTTFVKQATGEYPCDNYGKLMPDYALCTPDGDTVSLSDLRGKFLLIDFWASWCGPCKAEVPHVKAAYEAFKGAPIRFVSITSDRDDDAWRKAVGEINVPWLHLSSKGTDMLQAYGVRGIPRILVLDPEGRLVADHLNGKTIELQLNHLAKKYKW